MKKTILSLSAFSLLALPGTTLSMHHETMDHHHDDKMIMQKKDSGTIVDVASGNEDFSTLVSLVVQADLATTLASDGPFTVFAPTNKAFERMPSIYQRKLAAKPELLADVLLAHVVPGKMMAGDVLASSELTTANNQMLPISMWNGTPAIDDAFITATDVTASNGVIHVIDRVIFPKNFLAR